MKYILRSLIFVHRWVGIVLCLVFLLWFPSGIGMMYWTFPDVSASDRLEHSAKLDAAKVVLSPAEAAEKLGMQPNPTQIRLNSFDGRPVYRIGAGGRGGGGGRIIYADTGEEQTEVSTEMLDRIASSWAGQPLAEVKKESVEEPDQWTVAGQLRNLRPMYKYSWPDGQQVYLNGSTGEVVQYTTFGSRVAAHVSAIPHWFYYTPLRKNQPQWITFMIWSCIIGTVSAIVGMIVAIWMYSPKLRYRLDGKPTGIPYRGQKRWHWIFGMVFGVATVTWTFSGLLSLGPFPLVQRLTGTSPRGQQQQLQPQTAPEPTQQASADTQRGDSATGSVPRVEGPAAGEARGATRGGTPGDSQRRALRGSGVAGGRGEQAARTQGTGSGRGSGQQGIAGALRGRVRMADFASVHPRDLLARVPDLDVRELEFTSFASTPLFSANLGDGKSQLLSLEGTPVNSFEHHRIIDIVKSAVPDPKAIEIKQVDQYDLYYLDRTRQRPLPVLLVLMNDADKTRHYIDPKSARVVTTYSSRNWVNRWLYNGLHSLNFPFLYNNRPLWDIVVIAFMV
ncbi:MAG TPA: PepSY domain-containing protein, partial [Terriglobia bacterium]|nr:PepSY domain-containing protein [Terriglobia bacterium]